MGEMVSTAPGRINLLGEHMDYNNGLVMPCAIDRETQIIFEEGDDLNIYSELCDDFATLKDRPLGWKSYVLGTYLEISKRYSTMCIKGRIKSNIPIGSV